LRREIENLLQKQSEEEMARINSLVKIYQGMKPKDAARIFDTLDLDILVVVVSKMSERKLSPVLAAMNPERARTVTIMLAEQKQLPSLPQSN
jgi:flagellar motility protein MotE (MotC chaperone)